MSQAVWTGSITFGLVNIPVKLYPATEPKDVRFHLYDRRSGKRIHYERITRDEEPPVFQPEPEARYAEPEPRYGAPDEGPASRDEEDEAPTVRYEPPPSAHVEAGDVVRGIELPTGDLVTVSDDELVSIAPERSRTIAIEEFVELSEIDPVFFEKSYHVAPVRGAGAEKPYALLLRAMQEADMVGIGRFVLRTKPHLVAIRSLGNAIGLETLFFGDEVRSPADLVSGVTGLSLSEREVKMARQLISALATEWVPEKHADLYREELLDFLRSKPASAPAELVEAARVGGVEDLMDILRASVEAAKKKKTTRTSKRAG